MSLDLLFFYLHSGVEFDPYYDHHYMQVEARVADGNSKLYKNKS